VIPDSCLTAENKEPQTVLTATVSDAPRKNDPGSPKNFPTSPLLIRRSFKKAQNDPIPVEKIILIQDIIKEKSKQQHHERGVDVLMTPTVAKKSKTAVFATPATTPATFTTNNKARLATPKSEHKIQRSNSMTVKETPVKTEGLATSFLRLVKKYSK